MSPLQKYLLLFIVTLHQSMQTQSIMEYLCQCQSEKGSNSRQYLAMLVIKETIYLTITMCLVRRWIDLKIIIIIKRKKHQAQQGVHAQLQMGSLK